MRNLPTQRFSPEPLPNTRGSSVTSLDSQHSEIGSKGMSNRERSSEHTGQVHALCDAFLSSELHFETSPKKMLPLQVQGGSGANRTHQGEPTLLVQNSCPHSVPWSHTEIQPECVPRG